MTNSAVLSQPPTALGPNDPDDGDTGRQMRGMAIAALVPIKRNPLGYTVPSQSGNGNYVVNLTNGDEPFCSCPDFDQAPKRCKHIYAASFMEAREQSAPATPTATAPLTHFRFRLPRFRLQSSTTTGSPPTFRGSSFPPQPTLT